MFCLDTAPLDHRNFESFREMKGVVNFANELSLERGRNEIELEIKEKIFVRPKFSSMIFFLFSIIVPQMEKNSKSATPQSFR